MAVHGREFGCGDNVADAATTRSSGDLAGIGTTTKISRWTVTLQQGGCKNSGAAAAAKSTPQQQRRCSKSSSVGPTGSSTHRSVCRCYAATTALSEMHFRRISGQQVVEIPVGVRRRNIRVSLREMSHHLVP